MMKIMRPYLVPGFPSAYHAWHFDSKYLIGVVVPISKNVLLLKPSRRPFYSDRMNFQLVVFCPKHVCGHNFLCVVVEQKQSVSAPLNNRHNWCFSFSSCVCVCLTMTAGSPCFAVPRGSLGMIDIRMYSECTDKNEPSQSWIFYLI